MPSHENIVPHILRTPHLTGRRLTSDRCQIVQTFIECVQLTKYTEKRLGEII